MIPILICALIGAIVALFIGYIIAETDPRAPFAPRDYFSDAILGGVSGILTLAVVVWVKEISTIERLERQQEYIGLPFEVTFPGGGTRVYRDVIQVIGSGRYGGGITIHRNHQPSIRGNVSIAPYCEDEQ